MLEEGRIHAHPTAVTQTASVGLRPLKLGGKRDSYLFVPCRYRPQQPSPLVLLLHGAGQQPRQALDLLQHLADERGLILLAPASTGHTWDLITARTYGPDVALLDAGLQHVFSTYAIDPAHLAIGGFSDGASYALSLGVTNGDLFSHVLAFSPGFMVPTILRNQPRIFISHGTQDPILSVALCSRMIVPPLRQAGYLVKYNEFEGGHNAPPEVARHAVDWFIDQEQAH